MVGVQRRCFFVYSGRRIDYTHRFVERSRRSVASAIRSGNAVCVWDTRTVDDAIACKNYKD